MGSDANLPLLLERAAGPDPGPGDEPDVRRRARRYVRRRRTALGAAVAALLLPGLFIVGRFQADDAPDMVTSNPDAATQPGHLLFERSLVDGSALRVTTTEDPKEIAVEWPGSPEPVSVPLMAGAVSGKTTGDEWTVLALYPCPGDKAAHLRAFQTANPTLSDQMELVNGLAVVIVPPIVPPSYAPLPDTHEVTVETRDAQGNLLSRVTETVDVVASDEGDRGDELAEGTNPYPPPDVANDTSDGPPSRCEARP